MNNLDERAERAVLRRLGVSDMIHLITDQAKALTKVKSQSLANGRFICKQRAELKVANERVEELEKAVMDMGLRLTKRDIEDNIDVYKRLADK